MGLPMSNNLIKSGYTVYGFDLNTNSKNKFLNNGGDISLTLKQLSSEVDCFITMLPNGKIVKEIINKLIKYRVSDRIPTFIDMSSSSPIDTKKIFIKHKSKIYLIDAPVSGGVKKAIDGNLSIMVSGDKKKIKEIYSILKTMGSNVIQTGELGSAHAMKAINNYVSAAGLMAVMEALIIGKKFGINPKTVNKILNISSGKNNSTENKIDQFVISKKYASGFSLDLMSKDINIAQDLSNKLELNTLGLKFVAKYWKKAKMASKANSDHTKIFEYIKKISTKKN